MPFTFLLWRCLLPGKCSYQEAGVGYTVMLNPVNDETILFFHIDTEEFRKSLTLPGGNKVEKVADLLIFSSRRGGDPIALIVELKSTNSEDAEKQILSAIEAIRGKMEQSIRQETEFRGLIVSLGAAPKNLKRMQKDFKARRIRLDHCPAHRGQSVNLRPYLDD
jgi:hypothetical protein